VNKANTSNSFGQHYCHTEDVTQLKMSMTEAETTGTTSQGSRSKTCGYAVTVEKAIKHEVSS
jgi:hypothetical protein